MSHVVVIGYGMVGSRFVEDLTAADHAGEHLVTVLGDEACEPYNRVLLSDVVAGTRGLSSITLPAADHPRVTVQRGVAVRAIDRERRDVVLADDTRVPYDELVIATGAAARVPTVPGLGNGPGRGDLPTGVHVLRSIDDAREIIAATLNARRAIVLGGGVLGPRPRAGSPDATSPSPSSTPPLPSWSASSTRPPAGSSSRPCAGTVSTSGSESGRRRSSSRRAGCDGCT